ncbi:Protein of unknown function [Micromonospora pattaloongensis]|uniref:DUF1232 domain-containing protein n=1 Tax=Micromonospora pattaloongensis TaxID=405436 RepID=A0A1H3QXN3_9ACTN|nr:Protein of unknown function [Micromonospora pattaloongensis]
MKRSSAPEVAPHNDLIPDFIPGLGYADDAVIVTAVLRSTVRRAGLEAVRRHWPGTDDGFTALSRPRNSHQLCREPSSSRLTGSAAGLYGYCAASSSSMSTPSPGSSDTCR